MRILIIILFLPILSVGQIQELLDPHAMISLSGGTDLTSLPSRFNTFTEDSEIFGSNQLYTVGVNAELQLTPIVTEFGGYSYNLSGRRGWLGNNGSKGMNQMHNIHLKYEIIQATIYLGKGERQANRMREEYYNATNYVRSVSQSVYPFKRRGLGLAVLFKNKLKTEALIYWDTHLDIPSLAYPEKSLVYALKIEQENGWGGYAEMTLNHPHYGNTYIADIPNDLATSSYYFHARVYKNLSFKKKYR